MLRVASLLRGARAPLTTDFSRSVTSGQSLAGRFQGPAKMVTKISDLSPAQVAAVLQLAHKMKANPTDYFDALRNESLLMLFEKPSLRTRVSLEVGMTELGGHAISYMIGDSPLGKKETYGDTGACLSRYVAAITARVSSREQIEGLTANAHVPVVNALDDWAHPMRARPTSEPTQHTPLFCALSRARGALSRQTYRDRTGKTPRSNPVLAEMLADLQTIEEKFGSLKGIRMAYLGDIRNNVTYDLMRSGSLMGFTVAIAGPKGAQYEIEDGVLQECEALAASGGGGVEVCDTAAEAVAGADVVYTDSWQSYGITQTEERIAQLMPFQVTEAVMAQAKPGAVFMNCLPAMRGEEQTAAVIDGPQSIVFDQAENRLHAQKALLYLLITRQL